MTNSWTKVTAKSFFCWIEDIEQNKNKQACVFFTRDWNALNLYLQILEDRIRLTILICMNQDKQSLLSDISGRLHLDQQLSFASERGETESLPPPSDLWVYERVLGGGGYVSKSHANVNSMYSWGLTNPNGWREMSGGSVSANGNKAFHALLWYFEYCICLEMHGSPIRRIPPPMRGSLGAGQGWETEEEVWVQLVIKRGFYRPPPKVQLAIKGGRALYHPQCRYTRGWGAKVAAVSVIYSGVTFDCPSAEWTWLEKPITSHWCTWRWDWRCQRSHRSQRIHIGKNISLRFQWVRGSINPAGQNGSREKRGRLCELLDLKWVVCEPDMVWTGEK